MHTKSTLIAVLTASLTLTSAAVVAQEPEPEESRVAYAVGIAGNPPETIGPTELDTPDGELQFRGLQLIDIPVRFSDPRLSGRLTISSNGAGESFVDGFARIEPRTYRIENDGGSWSGAGERILAVSAAQPRPLINHESMVLFGDGDYDGLIAYVFIELANAAPELEAVILGVDMAPLPERVPTGIGRDLTGPRGPANDLLASRASGGHTTDDTDNGVDDRSPVD